MFQKVKLFFKRYEHFISPVAIFGGFIIDSLTLQRIDLAFENFVLFSYLALVAGSIAFINWVEEKGLQNSLIEKLKLFARIVIPFAFGGLFSGFLIFYSRSSAISASWPFLLLIVLLFLGTEFFKKRYLTFVFQMSVLFLAIFFYAIFYVPILVKSISAWVFVLSGVFSLVLIRLFVYGLSFFIPEKLKQSKRVLIGSISFVFILINVFYFLNIIPPIPLSLKTAEVYHSVSRQQDGSYVVLDEKDSWYEIFTLFDRVNITQGEPLYVLSAVFAPTRLNTEIVHSWQYFDEDIGRWVSISRIPFSISGGADGGYRGYSSKKNLWEGFWRVDIETPRGQIIGRVKFKIKEVKSKPYLERKVL